MTTKTNFECVCEFNETFDFPVFPIESQPLVNQLKVSQYRFDLIHEEGVEEFGKALRENDYVEMLDAVADHLYVLYGACHTFNIDPDFYIRTTYSKLPFNSYDNPTKLIFEQYNPQITIGELHRLNIFYEQMLHQAMIVEKNIMKTHTILMNMIINTYKIGFHLTSDIDGAFLNVHQSNMSKLCKSIEEAEQTVKSYQEKYKAGNSPYDSPYYYEIKPNLYVIKNKSTGKALKSINYTAAEPSQFLFDEFKKN
jgi:predicted HAD superfamily Cof-like phosphohydrolase